MATTANALGFVTLLCAIACTSAFADDLQREVASCAQIKGDLQRLQCFDSLAQAHGINKPKDPTPTVEGMGKWHVEAKTNPIDDTKTVVLGLVADSGKSRFGVPVSLVIRCVNNSTDLYINWQSFLGSESVVHARMGKEEAIEEDWNLSSDQQATIYPYDPVAYIKKMMTSNSFVAQVTPFNESPITAVFDTTGLENAIKPVRDVCKW